MFQPKDFIETAEGLCFAVVSGSEAGRVLCFLRYIRQHQQWLKLNTEQANHWLEQHHPQYLYYSAVLDAQLHAVPFSSVIQHYRPQQILQNWLLNASVDAVVTDLQNLCGLLRDQGIELQHWGVTGSLLIAAQKASSDIDLICYDRASFHQARQVVADLIERQQCQSLQADDWLDSYQRRCCDISLDDYIWHEARKFNKALYNGRKFDLSLLASDTVSDWQSDNQWQKLGSQQIEARVTDDQYAFDYPALFSIDHPQIQSVVCYTATYVGQAQTGEYLQAAGLVEVNQRGERRLLVGSSREASGEFVRIKQAKDL